MRLQMKSQRPELEPRWVAVTEKPCCNYSALAIFGDRSWENYERVENNLGVAFMQRMLSGDQVGVELWNEENRLFAGGRD